MALQRGSANSLYHPQCTRALISSPLPNVRYFFHIYRFLSVLRGYKKSSFYCVFPSFSWGRAPFHMFLAVCISLLWSAYLQLWSDFLVGYLSFSYWFLGLGDWLDVGNMEVKRIKSHTWSLGSGKRGDHGTIQWRGAPRGLCPGGAGKYRLDRDGTPASGWLPYPPPLTQRSGTLGLEGPRPVALEIIFHKQSTAIECPPCTRYCPRQRKHSSEQIDKNLPLVSLY